MDGAWTIAATEKPFPALRERLIKLRTDRKGRHFIPRRIDDRDAHTH